MTLCPRTALKYLALATSVALIGSLCRPAAAESPAPAAKDKDKAKAAGPLDFTLHANDGSAHDLAQYRGQVVLLVNTASRCGYTKQYTGLEKLYQDNKADGLVILAIPANQFGGQEPGSDEDIKAFCSNKYPITFPLMAKVVVKGKGIDPLYAYLTEKSPFPGAVGWNFNKFLIGRNGEVIARFDSKVAPADAQFLAAVKTALKAPVPPEVQAAIKAAKAKAEAKAAETVKSKK